MNTNKFYNNGLLYCSFNQDQGCFACGMHNGFRIYNSDPLKQKERRDFPDAGIRFVEMLFRCNYLALVGDGTSVKFSPNKLSVWDDVKQKIVTQLEFTSEVRGARLRRDRIVVVLDSFIKVYSFTQFPQQLHVFETCSNPRGLCALCPASDHCLLALPSRRIGSVQLVDLGNIDKEYVTIQAHNNAIAAMVLNLQGTLLATASEKGTLIRVFNTTNGAQLHELRRGTGQANIYSINFNSDTEHPLLCCSSDHGTVHVFKLFGDKVSPGGGAATQGGVGAQLSSTGNMVAKYLNQMTSIVKFQTPAKCPCVSAFGTTLNSILAVCANGDYYKFNFNDAEHPTREVFAQFLEMTDESS